MDEQNEQTRGQDLDRVFWYLMGVGTPLAIWLMIHVWGISAAAIIGFLMAIGPAFLIISLAVGLLYLCYRFVVGNLAYSRSRTAE